MLLQVSFLLISHSIWAISALQCLSCTRKANLTSSEPIINTTRSECATTNDDHSSCSHLLHIQYLEENWNALFEASPSDQLMLPLATRLMTNRTKIWLRRPQIDRTFEIHCFDTQSCDPKAINDIYSQRECRESKM